MTLRDRFGMSQTAHAVSVAFTVVATSALCASHAHAQAATASTSQEATPQESTEPTVAAILSNTRLRFYTDVGFGRPLQEKLPAGGLQNSKYSFQIADLHMFVTSKLSDDWNMLGELLITSDFTNESAAEMDRLLVQYTPSRHLRLGIGKYNTGVGYYPNQFHRAKFFQTATGRPLMFADEDNGGVLPIHQIGVTAQGEIPSGGLGLHYIGEAGNGRSFNSHSAEIQNFSDENNMKAVNGGLFIRPDNLPDLNVGFSVYRDTIAISDRARIRELITAAHAVWMATDLELLNEVVFVRHTPDAGGGSVTTKGFYTQFSRRFAATRPYVRYDYQDLPSSDPVFGLGDVLPPFGVRKVFSCGVRFEVGPLIVFKVQYDRALQSGAWANGAHAQLAVAF
jgi:hypothetical protein